MTQYKHWYVCIRINTCNDRPEKYIDVIYHDFIVAHPHPLGIMTMILSEG